MTYLGTPNAFGRIGDIETISSVDWAKIPTYYYDFSRVELPLTAVEFNNEFGAKRSVFNLDTEPDCNRQTNASVGSTVNEPFIAFGVGVIAIGEGMAFTVSGASFTRPAAAQVTPDLPMVPNGITAADGYEGVPNIGDTVAGTTQAKFNWGAPGWYFIEKFFQAYRLEILLNHRFLLVDESLMDIGMAPVPPDFIGASSSQIASMPYIRATNDVMAAKAINQVFIPANNFVDNQVAIAIPPSNSKVTYGHPRVIGLSDRIYSFRQPIVFVPGMRFEMMFRANEEDTCYRALQNAVTVSSVTPDAIYTDQVGTTDLSATMTTIPGGTISLGLVLKGYALQPQACIDYLSGYVSENSMYEKMYSMGDIGGFLRKYDVSGSLGRLKSGA